MLDTAIAWISSRLQRALEVYLQSLPSLAESLCMLAVLLALAFAIETASVGWPRSSLAGILRLSGTVRNDLVSLFLVYSGLGTYVAMAMTLGLLYVAAKWLRGVLGTEPLIAFETPLLAGVVFIVLADLALYWFHRLCHRVPTLWQVHAFHHSASEMTIIISGAREHPLVFPLTALVMLLPAALVTRGAETGVVLAIVMATRLQGLLIHSNMTADWGWVGRWIFVSPAMHRLHHGRAEQFHDTNFSSVLTIWDRLFGTWTDPRGIDIARVDVGLDDCPGGDPPLQYILATYRRFMRSAAGAIAALFVRRPPADTPLNPS
jgi:sterol desaturase/sphingolipid hydroxylase (fatty acid hydroxylase superfamily)